MQRLLPYRHCGAAADDWALTFFRALLAGTLSTQSFEAAVLASWASRDFVRRAPRTASWLKALADRPAMPDAGYASEAPQLGFRSQWLVGNRGRPGAIHIDAPGEADPAAPLSGLNRPPHEHDSGRIAVVTGGRAIFHVQRVDAAGLASMIDCPVEEGDMLFWPAWTAHTFNAQQGFSLVSAMASFVSPAEDGFVFPARGDLDNLPRRTYEDIRA